MVGAKVVGLGWLDKDTTWIVIYNRRGDLQTMKG